MSGNADLRGDDINAYTMYWDADALTWVRGAQPSTAAGAASTAAASTQVSVSNFPATSTQVSVSNQSTQVAVSNFPIQSTQVAVSNFPAASTDVKVSNYSTTAQVSSVGGVVSVQQNSTVWHVQQAGYVAPTTTVTVSSLAVSTGFVKQAGFSVNSSNELLTALAAYSTQIALSSASMCKQLDSTGGGVVGSTKALNIGANGLLVRQGSVDSTTFSGQAAGAGDNTIGTSAATQIYVYAYNLSALSTGAQLCRFLNGSTSEQWRTRLTFAGGSTAGQFSAIQELALAPPAYLFRTAAGNPLILNTTSSGVSYAVAAWRE